MDTPSTTALWPPAYNVRRSQRARRTFLQITPTKGLEIVVPDRLKRLNIEKLLEEKRSWIEKMLARFKSPFQNAHPNEQSYVTASALSHEKPNIIEYPALNETWRIDYQLTSAKRITLQKQDFPAKTLILKGDTENIALCLKALKKWIIKEANLALPIWLKDLSAQTTLRYHRVTIRGQRTLWGSCNAKKTSA